MEGSKLNWEEDLKEFSSLGDGEDDDFDSIVQTPGMFTARGLPQSESLDFMTAQPLSEGEIITQGKEAIKVFLSSRTVYDAMPKSGRVVVFDLNISLRLVLNALLEHEIGGAPLWSPSLQKIVGVMSLGDFSDIYFYCTQTMESVSDILDTHTVISWRMLIRNKGNGTVEEKGKRTAKEIASNVKQHELVSVNPNDTLYNACAILRKEKIHRIPIIDQENQTCLQLVTLQTILEYLISQFSEERRLFDQRIYDLGVGTYAEPSTSQLMGKATTGTRNIIVASLDSTLREVSDLFAKNSVSSIPILDPKTKKVRDIYRRSYIASLDLNLKEGETNPFNRKMQTVIEQYEISQALEPVQTCAPTDTLFQVFVKFAETKTRMLVVLDNTGNVCGICSLSDVLCYFL